GLVGFIGLGHDMASQEFRELIGLFQQRSSVSPAVRVFDAGKTGCSLECTAGRDTEGDAYWTGTVRAAVRGAGLSVEQVQVAWLEENSDAPAAGHVLPAAAQRVAHTGDLLTATLRRIKHYLPNVQIVYVSTSPYGRYRKSTDLERYVYEEAFAI